MFPVKVLDKEMNECSAGELGQVYVKLVYQYIVMSINSTSFLTNIFYLKNYLNMLFQR